MKLRKQQQRPVFTRIVDVELSDYISEKDLQYREAHLRTATKLSTLDYGAMPATSKIGDFIGFMVSDYQHLVDHTNSKLSGDLQKLRGQGHISDMEEEGTDIDRKVAAIDDKLVPLKGKFDDKGKQYGTEVRRWFRIFVPILIIIAFMELIANFDALNIGGNRISSIGLAILAGLSVYWWSHFTPGKITKYGGKGIKKQVALFALFLLPIVLTFYFFSSLRLRYLSALNPELSGLYGTSPLLFTVVNAFAYTISCWIIAAYKPRKETILAYKKYKSDLREIGKLEGEREALMQKKAALRPDLRDKLTDRFNILLLGKQTEREITTRMRGCFEEFKMELLLKTNSAATVLFSGDPDQDIPKLQLNYQDIDQNFEGA